MTLVTLHAVFGHERVLGALQHAPSAASESPSSTQHPFSMPGHEANTACGCIQCLAVTLHSVLGTLQRALQQHHDVWP